MPAVKKRRDALLARAAKAKDAGDGRKAERRRDGEAGENRDKCPRCKHVHLPTCGDGRTLSALNLL